MIGFPDIRVVAILEPNAIVNLITNQDIPKCANAAATHRVIFSAFRCSLQLLTIDSIGEQACLDFAVQQLTSIGVFVYIDGGHAGETISLNLTRRLGLTLRAHRRKPRVACKPRSCCHLIGRNVQCQWKLSAPQGRCNQSARSLSLKYVSR